MNATKRGSVRQTQAGTCGYGCTCPVYSWKQGDPPEELQDFGGARYAHTHPGCPVSHDGAECPVKPEQKELFEEPEADGEACDRSDA